MKWKFTLGLLGLLLSFYSHGVELDYIESVKKALRKIHDSDQATRQQIVEKSKIFKPTSTEIKTLWNKQNKIDAKNQEIVSNILDTYGWPTVSDYGSIGPAQVAFLVIQHANLEYQTRYYKMLKNAAKSGDLLKSSFALLEDRMLVRRGKKQVYGSQVKIDQKTGAKSFYPIEDELNVDKRRKEIGLQSLSEYAKLFDMVYLPVKD